MSLAKEEELASVADADVVPGLVQPTAHQEFGDDHLPDDDPYYYVNDAAAD
jgi:hypothetical protein